MFGLTFEKLLLVTIIAGVVIGPQQLPVYARRLGETIQALRRLVESSRVQAEQEMGLALDREALAALEVRQYDPRRIVRDALREPAPTSAVDAAILDEASRVIPGQKYLVSGSAAHPRRVLIESLPERDPRRIAAQAGPGTAQRGVDKNRVESPSIDAPLEPVAAPGLATEPGLPAFGSIGPELDQAGEAFSGRGDAASSHRAGRWFQDMPR